MQTDPKIVAEMLLSASILEAIPDAVAAVNQQGVIIQINSQADFKASISSSSPGFKISRAVLFIFCRGFFCSPSSGFQSCTNTLTNGWRVVSRGG